MCTAVLLHFYCQELFTSLQGTHNVKLTLDFPFMFQDKGMQLFSLILQGVEIHEEGENQSREILTSLPRFDLITLTFHENSNRGRENY